MFSGVAGRTVAKGTGETGEAGETGTTGETGATGGANWELMLTLV